MGSPRDRQLSPQGLESCVRHGLVVFRQRSLVLRLAGGHQSHQLLGELLVRLEFENKINDRIRKVFFI